MKQIPNNLNLARTTISSVSSVYQKYGRTGKCRKKGDFSTKLSNEKKAEFFYWVDDDASLTLNELCERVRQKMDIVVSKSTINRCLKAFHYSLKVMSIVPEKRNDQRTLRLRREYAHKFNSMILNFEHKRFVFLDEVGFSVTSRTKRARSAIATPAVMPVGATRSRKISVIASCNCLGILNLQLIIVL